jgi:predicted ester cyclase
MDYIDFWKLDNGKCLENWVQLDIAGVMRQLESKQVAL